MISPRSHVLAAAVSFCLAANVVGIYAAEKKLKMEEVPASVKATLEEQAKGGKIIDVDVSEQGGKEVYTSEIHRDGKEIDVQVAPDGKLIDVTPGEPLKAATKTKKARKRKTAQTTGPKELSFGKVFHEKNADLGPTGRNTYFILEPGHTMTYVGNEKGETTTLVITDLPETKKVDGVETRIVEERESVNGKVVEVSRNYFAISKRTGNVYYFGEAVDMYKDGQGSGHEGAWESGVNKAHYGLMMPATPLVGSRFYQEIAPGTALDRSTIVSTSIKLRTHGKTYHKVVKIEETTPLEPGNKEYKFYAPGIGLVKDGDLSLVPAKDKKK